MLWAKNLLRQLHSSRSGMRHYFCSPLAKYNFPEKRVLSDSLLNGDSLLNEVSALIERLTRSILVNYCCEIYSRFTRKHPFGLRQHCTRTIARGRLLGACRHNVTLNQGEAQANGSAHIRHRWNLVKIEFFSIFFNFEEKSIFSENGCVPDVCRSNAALKKIF